MYSPIKEWLLRWLEPYREVRASELLAWRIFAQKHNAAGKRPKCWYVGMEEEKGLELDPEGKVTMYEFPSSSPQAESELPDPDYLQRLLKRQEVMLKSQTQREAKEREEKDINDELEKVSR